MVEFKIVLLGDTASKTILVNRYLTKVFDESIKMTIGADFYVKDLEIDGKKALLRIWDCGGEQRFKVLLPSFVKGANGALLIYDIANYTSIKNIDDWLSLIRKEDGAEIPTLLVGIMSNEKKNRQVSVKRGKKIAKSKNLNGFIECNLKTGENVDKAFKDLGRLVIVDRIKKLEEELRYWRSQSKKEAKMKEYEEFIVYNLENRGNCTKLNITSEELQNHLNPKKVLIIICNHLKRIYIWKGAKSPVRERFISSRIAQDLQRKLIQDPRYNRCKIISIDQGEELQEFLNAFRLESMEVTDPLPDMRYPRNFERDKGDFKFLEEKLNNYIDTVERMMSVILRIPDLVDQSLATVNQKLSTLESRINGTTNQKSTTITKEGDQPTRPSSGGSRGAGPVNQSIKLFKINPDGTTTNIESDDPIKEILSSEECYVIVSDEYRKVYLWKGIDSNVRSKFIGAKRSQEIRGQVGMHFGVVPLDEGDEDPDFLKLIGGRLHRFDDEDRFPYPYVFKPPEPPDDLALAPRVQLHASPKKKNPEEKISCQYCGMEFIKEEQFTHSCKKKP